MCKNIQTRKKLGKRLINQFNEKQNIQQKIIYKLSQKNQENLKLTESIKELENKNRIEEIRNNELTVENKKKSKTNQNLSQKLI